MTRLSPLAPYAVLAVMFASVLVFRPLLPIDETRYATVAWEMWVRGDWLLPTLNFAPYHHKPPVLFWLVNASWSLFGVHRWAALVPIFLAAAALIWTTKGLARRLAPRAAGLLPWLTLSSVPFLVYGTLLMFDVLLTALIAGAYILLWDEAERPRAWRPFALGALIGGALLTKGPVALLFVLPSMALYPLWRGEASLSRFYLGTGVALLVALAVVVAWVVPVLAAASDGQFATWLLWEQTAGRIGGSFGGAHVRPWWFYLAIAPLLLLPWALFPAFWRGSRRLPDLRHNAWRFSLCVWAPALIAFSVIAGKQPHYILPLLPIVLVEAAVMLERGGMTLATARRTALAAAAVFFAAHAVAAPTVLHRYDLSPFAALYAGSAGRPWAFVPNYQGEIGFLARAHAPLDSVRHRDLPAWFAAHPDGRAIVRYTQPEDVAAFCPLYTQDYRSRHMGVFAAGGTCAT
ncbi:MAG: glycosyltransferase family 39 protein [Alphaproteobacteria bacterium]|jgi:4-amino-4-deoxy-L-arabinose transferase-like glycosyltransferase|nr:glycosyltransferase family 39 protein [Alphaproteobacteria bacterium]